MTRIIHYKPLTIKTTLASALVFSLLAPASAQEFQFDPADMPHMELLEVPAPDATPIEALPAPVDPVAPVPDAALPTPATDETAPAAPVAAESPPQTAPATGAPATAQPAAAATPATSAATPTISTPRQIATSAAAPTLSVGTFGTSIMYLPEDLANMMRILQAYEGTQSPTAVATGDEGDEDILSHILQQTKGPEDKNVAPFPDFYVSSIMYRGPGNWAVWVNGERFSSSQTPDESQPLSVKGISQEMVTLSWKPDNPARALELWDQHKAAKVRGFGHRSAQNLGVDFDDIENLFTVTMRPNQTFSGEKMDIMEGNPKSLLSDIPTDIPPVDDIAPAPVVAEPEQPAPEEDRSLSLDQQQREIADELFNTMMKMQKIVPVNEGRNMPRRSEEN